MFRSFGRNWTEYSHEKDTFKLGDASLSGHERNELWRNDGGIFTRVAFVTGAESTLDGRGFVAADFDRDGDLDLALSNNNQPFDYFENTCGTKRNWIVIQLRGTESNSFGIGARIRITTGEKSQVREMHLGSGYLSSPAPEAHFGLDEAESIDRIEIRWPSGKTQTVKDIRANRIVRIEEGNAVVKEIVPAEKKASE